MEKSEIDRKSPEFNIVRRLQGLYPDDTFQSIKTAEMFLAQLQTEGGIFDFQEHDIVEIIQIMNLYINADNYKEFQGVAINIKIATHHKHPMLSQDGYLYTFFPYVLQHCIEGCVADCTNFAWGIAQTLYPTLPSLPFSTKDFHRLACRLLRQQGVSFMLNEYEANLIAGNLSGEDMSFDVAHITDYSEIKQPCIILAVGPYGFRELGFESASCIGHAAIYIPRLNIFIHQTGGWLIGLRINDAYDLSQNGRRRLFAFSFKNL
ncbi:MAG: hypothetical protein H6850_04335 [Alphaproteobacteria bacterium]|nr:MAG: hypothetical protein H6850_04335 [Alphaproteobacteria bacterium]